MSVQNSLLLLCQVKILMIQFLMSDVITLSGLCIAAKSTGAAFFVLLP